jgi:two-component system response regulator ResD
MRSTHRARCLPSRRRAPPALGGRAISDEVLIIENDADLREALAGFLRVRGFLVQESCEGGQALELMRSCRPSVILLDLAMPGMDGYAFMEVQRSRADWARIPVIVMTAQSRPAVDADFILLKPFAAEQLVAAVRHFAWPSASRVV